MTGRFPLQGLLIWISFGLLAGGGLIANAHAGLTACEVVVVVNGSSLNSRTVANHFVALRKIPSLNVIVLPDVPNSEVVSVEDFRLRILRPLLAEIDQRKLTQHVQCIAYSADFPTAINLASDLEKLGKIDKVFTKVGSITGLTFLYGRVNEGIPSYIFPDANAYARGKIDDYFRNPGGERTREAWAQIQSDIAADKHAEALDSLETMLEEHPHQFPIAYLAAAEAAQAGKVEKSIELLQRAIDVGWEAGGYLAKDKRFDALRDNSDFQVLEFLLDEAILEYQPSKGFDARVRWTPNGIPVSSNDFGTRYLLCTSLAVTRGTYGTSIPDTIKALQRSATADFTHPQGGFYFSLTADVRTTTRKWGFLGAVDDLIDMGFEAEIVKTPMPMQKPKVLGAQLGTPSFDWSKSGSKFVPGALADNLTSFGGVMTPSSQTKLTEFIREGAAGASGTVTEPYAIQAKFPTPQMYVHYARGASLAEAFYSSVAGPYQLLVVGDPLCRPFSNAPLQPVDEKIRMLSSEDSLSIDIDLGGDSYTDWLDAGGVQATHTEPLRPSAVSVLFDGTNPQSDSAKPKLVVQLAGQAPGYHEVTLRFASDDPLSQRTERNLPIWLGPEDLISLSIVGGEAKTNGSDGRIFYPASLQAKQITVRAESTVADGSASAVISVWHDQELLGNIDNETHEVTIDLQKIGRGPARLQARVKSTDGAIVASQPVWLRVDP